MRESEISNIEYFDGRRTVEHKHWSLPAIITPNSLRQISTVTTFKNVRNYPAEEEPKVLQALIRRENFVNDPTRFGLLMVVQVEWNSDSSEGHRSPATDRRNMARK